MISAMLKPCICSRVDIALRKRRLKKAIHHARDLCFNFEDTKECRVAWDTVEDLMKAERKIRERESSKELEEIQSWEIMSDKEYDV